MISYERSPMFEESLVNKLVLHGYDERSVRKVLFNGVSSGWLGQYYHNEKPVLYLTGYDPDKVYKEIENTIQYHEQVSLSEFLYLLCGMRNGDGFCKNSNIILSLINSLDELRKEGKIITNGLFFTWNNGRNRKPVKLNNRVDLSPEFDVILDKIFSNINIMPLTELVYYWCVKMDNLKEYRCSYEEAIVFVRGLERMDFEGVITVVDFKVTYNRYEDIE